MRKFFLSLLLLLVSTTSFPSPIYAQNQNPIPQKETSSSDNIKEILPKELADELKKADEMGDSQFFQKFINMLFSLGVIIALIFLFMWILKRMLSVRMQQVNQTSTIKVLERRTLTPKTSIYILGAFGKAVAIAESSNGVTVLTELSKAEVKEESEKRAIKNSKH